MAIHRGHTGSHDSLSEDVRTLCWIICRLSKFVAKQ